MRLYYFTGAKYGLENIAKRRLKIARIKDLNDPFEFLPLHLKTSEERNAMRSMKKLADRDFGIICFTGDWEHPMMWSHYADRHRGMCLGFDVFGPRPIINVDYTPDLLKTKDLKLDTFDDMTVTDYMKTWFVKYDAWKYEAEARMVFELAHEQKEGQLFFHSFAPELRLAEVVVGAESDVTRDQVVHALGDLQNVELTKARLAFQRFAVVKQHQESMWRKTEDLDPDAQIGLP